MSRLQRGVFSPWASRKNITDSIREDPYSKGQGPEVCPECTNKAILVSTSCQDVGHEARRVKRKVFKFQMTLQLQPESHILSITYHVLTKERAWLIRDGIIVGGGWWRRTILEFDQSISRNWPPLVGSRYKVLTSTSFSIYRHYLSTYLSIYLCRSTSPHTRSAQNIRNTFLILSCTSFCPQNSLNLSGHGLYTVSKAFCRDVGPCWLQCFPQLCQSWLVVDLYSE